MDGGKQLDLFEDVEPENVVGDDYQLDVELAFQRRDGGVVTSGTISLGEEGDQLTKMLDAFTLFLNNLGFTYVGGLIALTPDGKEI